MSEAVVSVARTAEEVERLRPVWNELAPGHIDSDIDYFLAVAGNGQQVVSPFVVHIRRASLPDILIVARLENLPVRFRLAYWTFARTTVRAVVVAFNGVLGARGPDDLAMAMAETLRLLSQEKAGVILMRNVQSEGELHSVAKRMAGALRVSHAQRVDRAWSAVIPRTLDLFLAGRSARTRSTLRRDDRLLREALGDGLRLRRFDRIEELGELCRDMTLVSSRTYQGALGAGYNDSPMERALVSLGLRKGIFRGWILYAGERPIAYWAGMAHGQTFFPTTPGFDPAFTHLSVGRYTMFRMIEDLCAEGRYTQLDLGRGDAQYKREYAVATGDLVDVWVAAPRPRPIMIVGMVSLSAAIDRAGRTLIDKLSWAQRLKKAWRRKLSSLPGGAKRLQPTSGDV